MKFRWIKIFLSRAMLFYLVLYGLSFVIIDHDRITYGLKMRTLNILTPESFDALFALNRMQSKAPEQVLRPYIIFYQKVAEYMPERGDTYNFLGYCFYYRQDYTRALAALNKSIELDSKYFWTYHNLGVLYFKNGNYSKAIEALNKALKSNLNQSLAFIEHPKSLYSLALSRTTMKNYNLKQNMAEGYYRIYRLLALSLKNVNQKSQALEVYNKALTIRAQNNVNLSDDQLIQLQLF